MLKKMYKNIVYENAVIIAINLEGSNHNLLREELNELTLLSDTAGFKIVDTIIQTRHKVNSATFIGKGKIKSAINNAKGLNSTVMIFNDDLSPAQLKNIQNIAGDTLKIIDRSGLILDIFEKHAKTKEAKVQIKLAKLKYLLPRLTKQWSHLERQMGGVGTRGGPGEAQIEIDRRLIRKQIINLNEELKNIQKQRSTQHKSRENIYKVSLVGYTNSGKSTIMKSITKSNVYIEDQLFATLDTTTRKVENKNEYNFLLSDTVGFIRNLPHDLIASFRSTLMEIEESDLIIKVLDASSTNIDIHLITIRDVLKSLNVSDKLELIVFNKIDLIDSNQLNRLKKLYPDSLFIAAYKKIKIDELLISIQNQFSTLNVISDIDIPYDKLHIIDYIYKNCKVLTRTDEYDKIILKIETNPANISRLKHKIK